MVRRRGNDTEGFVVEEVEGGLERVGWGMHETRSQGRLHACGPGSATRAMSATHSFSRASGNRGSRRTRCSRCSSSSARHAPALVVSHRKAPPSTNFRLHMHVYCAYYAYLMRI
jgi:hypothetical protein